MEHVSLKTVGKLTFQDVVSYFAEKEVRTTCASCGQALMSIICKDNEEVVFLAHVHPDLTKVAPFAPPNSYHLSVLTECQNCGHMVQYSFHLIERWLEARRKSGK